jgi:ribosome-associated toxin RatA of RatAB toxin-antitoxin module
MARVNRSALVMYSAEQMFKLVNDVEAYSNFNANAKALYNLNK